MDPKLAKLVSYRPESAQSAFTFWFGRNKDLKDQGAYLQQIEGAGMIPPQDLAALKTLHAQGVLFNAPEMLKDAMNIRQLSVLRQEFPDQYLAWATNKSVAQLFGDATLGQIVDRFPNLAPLIKEFEQSGIKYQEDRANQFRDYSVRASEAATGREALAVSKIRTQAEVQTSKFTRLLALNKQIEDLNLRINLMPKNSEELKGDIRLRDQMQAFSHTLFDTYMREEEPNVYKNVSINEVKNQANALVQSLQIPAGQPGRIESKAFLDKLGVMRRDVSGWPENTPEEKEAKKTSLAMIEAAEHFATQPPAPGKTAPQEPTAWNALRSAPLPLSPETMPKGEAIEQKDIQQEEINKNTAALGEQQGKVRQEGKEQSNRDFLTWAAQQTGLTPNQIKPNQLKALRTQWDQEQQYKKIVTPGQLAPVKPPAAPTSGLQPTPKVTPPAPMSMTRPPVKQEPVSDQQQFESWVRGRQLELRRPVL